MVLPDDDSLKPAFYQGLVEGVQVCGLLLDEVLQFVDAGNLCVSGGSVNRTFFSLFPEFEDLVGNLIIGFKVNSERAVQFRKWVNQIAKDYTIKGWVMDDERLKRGMYLTEKYFDEQLERIFFTYSYAWLFPFFKSTCFRAFVGI